MCLFSGVASAQTNAAAEQLFVEGRTLLKDGQTERACEKFKASYALDLSAYGTLLNLALCHEQTGRAATAWAEFRIVAAASAGVREDRASLAREHEAKLRPTLSYLTIVVPADARVNGLKIRIDQQVLESAALNGEIPVDPGPHVVESSAPGKTARTDRVVIGAQSDHQKLTLKPLVDAPKAPLVIEKRSFQWTAGIVVGAVGVVAAGVGLALGASASSQLDEARGLCRPDGTCASQAAKDEASRKHASASTTADVSTVVTVAGAVLAATGLVLVLTAGTKRVTASAVGIEGTF